MPASPDPAPKKLTCFVVMGYGKKTDFETGRVLDLNQSYESLIKPAVETAGLECIRADEVVHSGLIDVPMYELLLKADVVVADISTSNRNAIYELGVRHALRPFTTVVIAEEQLMKSPFFDLNHIVIRKYRHLGEDIGVSEAKRFTTELANAIRTIMAVQPELRADSPVYQFIKRLSPPSLTEEVSAAVAADVSFGLPAEEAPAHGDLMTRADDAQKEGDWMRAKILLEEIRRMRKTRSPETPADRDIENSEDPYILQRLALATYKSKSPTPAEACKSARDLLSLLDPQTSNDTETLGLWGSVHKQLWDLTAEGDALNVAVRAYERGFHLRNDYYNGINFAYLLNVRAAHASVFAEAIADFMQARRVRAEVLHICARWLDENEAAPDSPALAKRSAKFLESRYWALATIAEAHIGLEESQGSERLDEAFAAAPEPWMKQATQTQVEKLKHLLETSPLKKLEAMQAQG